jgi:hypothetical protein
VVVQGNTGLMIEGRRAEGSTTAARPNAQLMWSAGDSIYVLEGNVRSEELFAIAQTLQ